MMNAEDLEEELHNLGNLNAEDLLSDTAYEAAAQIQALKERFGLTGRAAKEFDDRAEDLGNTLLDVKEKSEILKNGNEGLRNQFVEIKSAISGYESALNDFGKSIT